MKALKILRQAIFSTIILMALCGFAYPVFMTFAANLLFKNNANGGLIYENGKAVASKFVGQEFSKDYFLHSRVSSLHYNTYVERDGKKFYLNGDEFGGISSGSDNYANSNPDLKKRVESDMKDFLAKNPSIKAEQVPTDLLTSSGSGLDPHISVAAALVQVPRVAKASGLDETKIKEFIADNTSDKLFGIFGAKKVNVVGVNLQIAKAMGKI